MMLPLCESRVIASSLMISHAHTVQSLPLLLLLASPAADWTAISRLEWRPTCIWSVSNQPTPAVLLACSGSSELLSRCAKLAGHEDDPGHLL